MPEELKRSLRDGEQAERLELLEESQKVAAGAIVDGIRALDVQLGNVGFSALSQPELNCRVLAEVGALIDRQLSLVQQIQTMMSDAAPGKSGAR